MELLAEVARDAERALQAVEQDDELIAAHEVAEAARRLREIVGQEFEVEDDEVPRPRRAAARAGSSPPTTPRCATAAPLFRGASPATSSTPRPPPRRRS
jgi:hypothetical protein